MSLNAKTAGSVLLMRKFIKINTAKGTTETTDKRRKLFLKPVVLTVVTITAEITHIATEAYFAADKSISSFKNNSETIELSTKTDNTVDIAIFTIYPVNNPFELVADILGIKKSLRIILFEGI